MKHPRIGVMKNIFGFKLYELSDGFYEDDFGKLYDYNHGKLYRQEAPGKWFWLRQPIVKKPELVEQAKCGMEF